MKLSDKELDNLQEIEENIIQNFDWSHYFDNLRCDEIQFERDYIRWFLEIRLDINLGAC